MAFDDDGKEKRKGGGEFMWQRNDRQCNLLLGLGLDIFLVSIPFYRS